ncbi:MAG: hypothetical protein ABI876_18205 [Bacteroidota bacterium]
MWDALQHQHHINFFEGFHAVAVERGEDWTPIIRAIRHLQSLEAAPRLYAFTSHWRFHLTTCPAAREFKRHFLVSILWRFPDRVFHIAFGRLADGWADDRPPEQICDELAFPAVIELFIQRLLMSSSLIERRD